MKPNFIFIGPSKSGSTWIYEFLRCHPDVFVPTAKDLYFFDKNFDRGLSWYKSFFEKSKVDTAGEICHDYLSNFEALKRIKKFSPNIKLICCLRNPVDRAWSSYQFFKRNGVEKDFFSTVESHPIILEEGFYARHLKNIYSLFPSENILILDFQLLSDDLAAFAKSLTNFLEIPYFFPKKLNGKKINSASKPRSSVLAKIIKYTAIKLRKFGFVSLVGFVKRNNLVLKLFYKEIDRQDLSIPYLIKESIKDVYKDDINELEQLLNEDYSHWLR